MSKRGTYTANMPVDVSIEILVAAAVNFVIKLLELIWVFYQQLFIINIIANIFS